MGCGGLTQRQVTGPSSGAPDQRTGALVDPRHAVRTPQAAAGPSASAHAPTNPVAARTGWGRGAGPTPGRGFCRWVIGGLQCADSLPGTVGPTVVGLGSVVEAGVVDAGGEPYDVAADGVVNTYLPVRVHRGRGGRGGGSRAHGYGARRLVDLVAVKEP